MNKSPAKDIKDMTEDEIRASFESLRQENAAMQAIIEQQNKLLYGPQANKTLFKMRQGAQDYQKQLAEKDAELKRKNAELERKDAEIQRLTELAKDIKSMIEEVIKAIIDNQDTLQKKFSLDGIPEIGAADIDTRAACDAFIVYVHESVQVVNTLLELTKRALNLPTSESNASAGRNRAGQNEDKLSDLSMSNADLDNKDEERLCSSSEIHIPPQQNDAPAQEAAGQNESGEGKDETGSGQDNPTSGEGKDSPDANAGGADKPKKGKTKKKTKSKSKPKSNNIPHPMAAVVEQLCASTKELLFRGSGLHINVFMQRIADVLAASNCLRADASGVLIVMEQSPEQLFNAEEVQQQLNTAVELNGCVTVAGPIKPGTVFRFCKGCNKVHEFRINGTIENFNITVTVPALKVDSSLNVVHRLHCSKSGADLTLHPAELTAATVHTLPNEAVAELIKDAEQDEQTGEQAENNTAAGQGSERDDVQVDEQVGEQVGEQVDEQVPGQASEQGGNPLTREQINRLKAKQRKRERKDLYKAIISHPLVQQESIDLRSMLVEIDGVKVINPVEFLKHKHVFAALPMFKKNDMTNGFAMGVIHYFTCLGVPKSRLHTMFNNRGLDMSKQDFICFINDASRVFYPVYKYIHEQMLTKNRTLIIDETFIHNREAGKKCLFWAMVSGRCEELQAAVFMASGSRSHMDAMNFVGAEQEEIDKVACEYMTTDGYIGYKTAIRKLNEKDDKYQITHTACLTHARRPLHRYLDSCGLLKVYKSIVSQEDGFINFPAKLNEALEKKTYKTLTEKGAMLLAVYYFINVIFALDGIVADKYNCEYSNPKFLEELRVMRKEYIGPVLEMVYELMAEYIAAYEPFELTKGTDKDGNPTLIATPKLGFPEAGALNYLINVYDGLRTFVDNPEVEISSNSVERSIRPGVCARKSMLFLDTWTGLHAFSVCMTLAATCRKAGVDLEDFLLWHWANQKLRGEDMMINQEFPDNLSVEFNCRPTDVKDEETGDIIEIFDDKYNAASDHINMVGISPMDMGRYLKLLSD